MKKQTFLEFLKEQKRKKYSSDLILKHLKDGWEEIDDVVNIPIIGVLDTKNKRIKLK